MRCVKFLFALFLLTFLFANCSNGDGSGGVVLKEGQTTVMAVGPGGSWGYVIFYGPSKSVDTDSVPDGGGVIVEDPNSAEPKVLGHGLISGTIQHNGFSGGKFLVEVRGTANCGDSLCPDYQGVPTASAMVSQPGFFSLVVPITDRAVYLVAQYTNGNQASTSKEIYLGILDGGVSELVFNFGSDEGEPQATPEPTPTPDPTPGPGGPTDLVSS